MSLNQNKTNKILEKLNSIKKNFNSQLNSIRQEIKKSSNTETQTQAQAQVVNSYKKQGQSTNNNKGKQNNNSTSQTTRNAESSTSTTHTTEDPKITTLRKIRGMTYYTNKNVINSFGNKINKKNREEVMWYSVSDKKFKYGTLGKKIEGNPVKYEITDVFFDDGTKFHGKQSPISESTLRKYNKIIKEKNLNKII